MPRTKHRNNVSIISGTLVFITYEKRNRCSGRFAFKDSRENLDSIFLAASRCKFTLTGFSAVKKYLNIFFI